MKFSINEKMFEVFPGLVLGVIAARSVNNEGASEDIERMIRKEEERIRSEHSLDTLAKHPNIEVWRNAYKTFGAKPKEHRSSVENLYKLVLEGVNLRHINTLVDIYNFISLKNMLPAGGEDLDKIKGDILLTLAEANEPAVMLLGDKEARPPHEGEVMYKDDISAICRRWNWREAERTKLMEHTKNAILVIEALPPVTKEEVESATKELKELIEKFCGGEIDYSVLEKENAKMEIAM